MTFTHIIITSRRGSQEGEAALSFDGREGGTVPPEADVADVASVMDAGWPGLLGDILQPQSTYSFGFVHIESACWGL